MGTLIHILVPAIYVVPWPPWWAALAIAMLTGWCAVHFLAWWKQL